MGKIRLRKTCHLTLSACGIAKVALYGEYLDVA